MHEIDRKRYFWVGLTALFQGLMLGKYSYTFSGAFLSMPLTVVVVVPFALWLAQENWGRRLRRFLGLLTAILVLFYVYNLWSVYLEDSEFNYMPTQNLNLIRISAAVFLSLPFFQCRIATWSWRVPYSDIFFQLCRNVFLLFQALIVTVVFWALLLTASLLFDIVGLDFVPLIVFDPLVAFPLTTLTIAFSITLALKHPGIDSLGRWILSILAWLLPPFSLLSAVFVISLPFSGLRTLWDTGQASSLMLMLQLATILLANAAWLDGTRNPFSNPIVDAVARLSLLCLPIYTTLCLYSLGLRVQQYGWSVDRIHAAFFVVMNGIWGLGYAGLVILRQWPVAIGRINMAAALIFGVTVVAMNSPLLDPYRLAANSQAERLLEGQADPESFDFLYLRFNLGRYGNYALRRLNETPGLSAVVRGNLREAMNADPKEHWKNIRNGLISEKRRREILRYARVFPEERALPPALVESLVSGWGQGDLYALRTVRNSSDIAFSFKKILTEEHGESLLLIKTGAVLVFDISDPEPALIGTAQGPFTPAVPESEDMRIYALPPRFMDLTLDGRRYQIYQIPLQR